VCTQFRFTVITRGIQFHEFRNLRYSSDGQIYYLNN